MTNGRVRQHTAISENIEEMTLNSMSKVSARLKLLQLTQDDNVRNTLSIVDFETDKLTNALRTNRSSSWAHNLLLERISNGDRLDIDGISMGRP